MNKLSKSPRRHAKKTGLLAVLLAAMLIGILTGNAGPSQGVFRNLKVLPQNINSKKLEQIMVDDFQDGLGVSCNFCHADTKGTHRPDYVSDAKPEKKIARAMMRMTLALNKKYFNLKHLQLSDSTLVVTCNTCHHGQPRPEGSGE